MFFFLTFAPSSAPKRPVRSGRASTTRAFVGLGLVGLALTASAQVEPVLPKGLAPVVIGSAPLAPVGVVTAPTGAKPIASVALPSVVAVNMGLVSVVEQFSSGKITPDAAWESGLIKADDIVQLLEMRGRLAPDERNEELKRQLIALLVLHAPEKVADPTKLSARVRIELCGYYSEQGDARAIPLCETLIKEKLDGHEEKQPTGSAAEPDNSTLWLGPIIFLAKDYEQAGKWQKAGETWERAAGFWQDVSWWQAGVRVDAARAYTQTSNTDRVQQLYSEVPKFGDDWSTGVALMNQAAIETQKGNSTHARQLLLQPTPLTLPAVQLAILSMIGHSYYVDGEFANARNLLTQVVSQAQTFQGSRDDRAEVAVKVNVAKEHLRLIKQWTQTPLVCEPSQVSVCVSSLENEPVTRWLYVSSFRDVPVKVESNNPLITVKEGQKQWEDDEQLQYNQEFEVIIGTGAARSIPASWLSLTSARFPTVQVRIPVQFKALEGGDYIGTSSKKTP